MARNRTTGRTRQPQPGAILAGSAAALFAMTGAVTAAHDGLAAADEGANAELIAVCRQFLAVDAEIRRVQMAGGVRDEVMDALNDQYYPPLERLIQLPARTPAGLHLKAAAAYAAMVSVTSDLQREEQAGLAVLRDMAGDAGDIGHTAPDSPDAELIRLCDRLVALRAEENCDLRCRCLGARPRPLQRARYDAIWQEHEAIDERLH